MNTNLPTIVCILTILIFATTETTSAQTIIVGVSPGNTLDYSYSLFWESTDPTATIPLEYIELNNTQLIQIGIRSVS
jgi:hypothetical protein